MSQHLGRTYAPVSGSHPAEIRAGSGLVMTRDQRTGDMTIGLDERIRGALMIDTGGNIGIHGQIAFQFPDHALNVQDVGGAVVFRIFDQDGLHISHVDLKTVATIVDFLQGVLARDAEKIMAAGPAPTEAPR